MLRRKLMIALMAVGLSSGVAMAENFDQNGVSTGTMESSVFGSLTATSPGSSTQMMIGVSQGVFISDTTQIGGDIFWVGSDTSNTMNVSVFGKYHFNGNNPAVLPYVGGKVGLILTSGSNVNSQSAFSYGVNGGVKMFQTENVSMNIEGFYEPYTIGGTAITNTGVRLGISIYK